MAYTGGNGISVWIYPCLLTIFILLDLKKKIQTLSCRTVLSLQQNWGEGTEISHTFSVPTQA